MEKHTTSARTARTPTAAEPLATRREAFQRFGRLGLGVALASVPAAFAALARPARAQDTPPDMASVEEVLRFALTLEYLEYEFYRHALNTDVIPRGTPRHLYREIRDHELAHVRLLERALGLSEGEAQPEFDFTASGAFDPFGDYHQFLLLSQGFEDTGVRAYKGQAANLLGTDVLTTALQIHSVEARHASVVRRLRGEQGWIPLDNVDAPPGTIQAVYDGEAEVTQAGVNLVEALPETFSRESITESYDEPLDMEAVLAIASPFIVS